MVNLIDENLRTHPFGYFADPKTRQPLVRCYPEVRHLDGIKHRYFWWVEIPQYELTKEILFVDSKGWSTVVPAGFVFNGASVPWVFWPVCSPDNPDTFAASAVHDWLCTPIGRTTLYRCTSLKAANVFYDAMRAQGMYPFGASRNYWAVRTFGPTF